MYGVRRFRVCGPADDPSKVIVDLEFDTLNDVEVGLPELRKLWTKVDGMIMVDPQPGPGYCRR